MHTCSENGDYVWVPHDISEPPHLATRLPDPIGLKPCWSQPREAVGAPHLANQSASLQLFRANRQRLVDGTYTRHTRTSRRAS